MVTGMKKMESGSPEEIHPNAGKKNAGERFEHHYISVRLDEATHRALSEHVHERGTSIQSTVEFLIKRAVKDRVEE